MTVPALLMPLSATVSALGPSPTVLHVALPILPLSVTPAPVKPLTGLLNTAVKLIGELLVGSAWPAAWLIVTVGGVVSGGVKLTLLSVVVVAGLAVFAASGAARAGVLVITVPGVVMPETATL